MAKKRRLKKDDNIRQRLLNIEIDEISLVDKPAIEDEFIITKRVKGKGGKAVAKKKKKSKKTKTDGPVKTVKTAKEIQKGVFWKRSFKKDAEGHDHGEHCGFCGITKADEAEQIGMGLRCDVCFKCAVTHMEKGVVDDCIDGTFSFDSFKEKHPDVKLFVKEDEDGDADGDEETEAEKLSRLKAAKEKSEDEDSEDDDDEDSEDSEDEDSEDDDDDEDSEDSEDEDSEDSEDEDSEDSEDEDEDKESEKTTVARIGKVEKGLEDIIEMLAGSMEFHEQAVSMLSQQAELMMGALEMILMGAAGAEQSEATVTAAGELKSKIKSFRKSVQKAGAKISAGRLQTLQDIAEKLTALIQSVSSDVKEAQGGKKGSKKNKKSIVTSTDLDSLKQEIADLKKSVSGKDEQLEKLANRLDDFEAFGEGSAGMDDDELDEDDDSDSSEGESVFKGFGPLGATVDRMEKRTRTVTKKKGDEEH